MDIDGRVSIIEAKLEVVTAVLERVARAARLHGAGKFERETGVEMFESVIPIAKEAEEVINQIKKKAKLNEL